MWSLALLSTLALGASAADVLTTLNLVNAKIAPDGFEREASLVNGVFPGTTIFANRGDTIKNLIVNKLADPSMKVAATIHWHGLFQANSSWEDGPAFVTQCPISPGHSYEYSIPLRNQDGGSHWYHSHLGAQYVDGIRGSVVVYDPEDPHKSLYDVDDKNTLIELADWYHESAEKLSENFIKTGTIPCPNSGLVNGRGRYKKGPAVPWSVINVEAGKRYRFRVFNHNALGDYAVSIDGHTFDIIEADGVAIQPIKNIKSFIIHPGQRYSIVLTANQKVDNYWLRAPIEASCSGKDLDKDLVKAVLRYKGAASADPKSSAVTTGTVFAHNMLKPLVNPGAPGGSGKADVVIDLKYGKAAGPSAWGVSINGKPQTAYAPPDVPTLLKILSNNATVEKDFATTENTIVLPFNKVVELRIAGSSGGFTHPWHLHGHAFDVITDGQSAANYVDPPRRDVVGIRGGQGIIRFRTDNPGPWFLHCHIDWHLEVGLAVVFAESPEQQRAYPKPASNWDELCPLYNALPESQRH